MKTNIGDEDEFTIPLTPMIDVVFLLLIFFLLQTTVIDEERNVVIKLPTGTQGEVSSKAAGICLVVGVQSDGRYSLGGMVLPYEDLRRRLLDHGDVTPKPMVKIQADKRAEWMHVARAFQLCREVKINDITISYIYGEEDANQP
jgi:biopolymer transport protein ExbD